MNKARDLVLELYKEDHITKSETKLLLDAIEVSKPPQLPYIDWTYRPAKWNPSEWNQWTITNTEANNKNNANVE
jgi:hypothetical protein